jgi:hypothetical protein
MAGHCDKSPTPIATNWGPAAALRHGIELSSRTNDHDRTNERGRQIETAPSLGRKRPRRHFVQATYVPVPKGPLANSKRATDVKRGQHHPTSQERNVNTVKGSASGTIPPLRGFTFRWGWSRSHGFGGAPNMGWGAGIEAALNTKRCGGKRKRVPTAGGVWRGWGRDLLPIKRSTK